MENCPCPPLAAIPTIPAVTCPENIGQIVRFIITRQKNVIATSAATALLLATYTAKLTAIDGTKIQITPKLLEGVVIPMGEPIKEGGDDNSTPLGRARLVGSSTIQVEGMIANIDSKAVAAIQAIACDDIDLAFVNHNGEIFFKQNADLTLRGFPVHAFFIGDKGAEGLNTVDKAKITFGLDSGWRNDIVIVKPIAFDPRFDL